MILVHRMFLDMKIVMQKKKKRKKELQFNCKFCLVWKLSVKLNERWIMPPRIKQWTRCWQFCCDSVFQWLCERCFYLDMSMLKGSWLTQLSFQVSQTQEKLMDLPKSNRHSSLNPRSQRSFATAFFFEDR